MAGGNAGTLGHISAFVASRVVAVARITSLTATAVARCARQLGL